MKKQKKKLTVKIKGVFGKKLSDVNTIVRKDLEKYGDLIVEVPRFSKFWHAGYSAGFGIKYVRYETDKEYLTRVEAERLEVEKREAAKKKKLEAKEKAKARKKKQHEEEKERRRLRDIKWREEEKQAKIKEKEKEQRKREAAERAEFARVKKLVKLVVQEMR